MNISSEGKDILANIDEVLATEYECIRMLTAFDNGNGPKGLEAKELIKLIKDSKQYLDSYVDDLSIEDAYAILNKTYKIEDGNYMFGVAFNISKDKMLIIRTLNELLSKYLRAELNLSEIDYRLLLSEYLTIDMLNILIIILTKMLPDFNQDIQKQIIIARYYLAFCMKEVEGEQIDNNYQPKDNTYIISKTAHSFCDVPVEIENEFINYWAIETFYNAFNNILNSNNKELSINNIVNSAIMRTILVLVDEELASDLMHNTMNYLHNKQVPNINEELLFDAITSRFEDEIIPRFVSFTR